jgi:steroid 5-alpha reductase family enzyme
MNVFWLIIVAQIIASIAMCVTWYFSVRNKNAGIVDVVWTFLVAIIATFYALFIEGGWQFRQTILFFLVWLWSFRLGTYLWARVRRETEDARYADMKVQWGKAASYKMFQFFQYQAIAAVLLSTTFVIGMRNANEHWQVYDSVGILIALLSILGEGLADRQLAAFKRDNPDRKSVCRNGLWAYSRHPNYFFEWTYWLAFPLFAVGHPYFVLACISPAFLFYFITRVTGIPPTEAHLIRSKGDLYRQYQREVSPFFPVYRKR